MPEWSGKLRNLYWFLRYNRKFNEAKRRKYYRLIAAEKKRLYETGVDAELVRLLCLHLVNLTNKRAEANFYGLLNQLKLPFQPPQK